MLPIHDEIMNEGPTEEINGYSYSERHPGSGSGSDGRAVASNSEGPLFESSHQKSLYYLYTINCIEKTKMKGKRQVMAHFIKIYKET